MLGSSLRHQALLNAYWIPLNLQNAALLTIAVPHALKGFAGINPITELAVLATLVAAISTIVLPLGGEISDRLHRAGSPRRPVIILGGAVNAVALLWMAVAHNATEFGIAIAIAALGQNISFAAYSALIPEVVAHEHWGAASGFQGVGTLLGTIIGFAVAGSFSASATFVIAGAFVFAGAFTVFATPEGPYVEREHVHVSDWTNFTIAFTSRFWTNFGLILLGTYAFYFFSDVLKVGNAQAATSFFAILTMVGAIVTSVATGYLSDRVPRKFVVSLAGVPMALAVIGFALVPREQWIFVFALFFGLGYGAILSTGWALAIDSVPKLANVARDLGVWGVAANLPAVFAPPVGAWILGRFAADGLGGYRTLFIAAGLSFVIGSIFVLWTGRRHEALRLPRTGGPLQAFAMAVIHPYYLTVYRIRKWGRLPLRRGATLAISNHQHDLDTTGVIMRLSVQGPWHVPIFCAGSRRLFEPGFMGMRTKWLEPIIRAMNWAPLFRAIGILPIENELRVRPVASIAWNVYRRHGDIGLADVFRPGSLDGVAPRDSNAPLTSLFSQPLFLPAQKSTISLAAVREPYRSELVAEMRTIVEADIQRLEGVLRAGGTLYLTPEGRYTTDGRIGRFRTTLARLAPLATVYVLPVSYDPFVGRRLSMLFRVLPAQDPGDLRSSLAAPRPITVSQLLAAWHIDGPRTFTLADAEAAVRERLTALPAMAFIDPELKSDPDRMVRRALDTLTRLGILEMKDSSFSLGATRKHPQFPNVDDIVAHQANFFGETTEALHRLQRSNVAVDLQVDRATENDNA
jgi:MFS family permease